MKFWSTTSDFIANGNSTSLPVGTVIEFKGFTSAGDGGGAQWELTANTGTPSQYPYQIVDALFNDPSGRQWKLVFGKTLIVEKLGGVVALQAALNSRAPEVAFFTESMNLDPVTYTIYSGQHLHGAGKHKCTLFTHAGLALTASQFRNEAPSSSTDGVRYDKGIKFSGFTINASARVYPKWLSNIAGTVITNPEFDYSPSGIIGLGGTINDVVAADRRNAGAMTVGKVIQLIKVNSPEVFDIKIVGHESLGITDEGCLNASIHDCDFIDCGKIDNISSPIWAQSFGSPTGSDVFYQDTENHVTEHCYFECKRSAITLNPTKGGAFRFNHVAFNGESSVFSGSQANYNGGRIDVHNNKFGETTLTDIAAAHVENNGSDNYHVYDNEFFSSDFESVNCAGATTSSVRDNTFKNCVRVSTVNYPYGPFSERYAYAIGTAPIAGTAIASKPVVNTGTLDSVGCNGIHIHDNDFIDDRVTSPASGIVGLTRSGTANLSKNIAIANNDRSGFVDVSVPMIHEEVVNVMSAEMSISCKGNIGDASEVAKKVTAQIAVSDTGLKTVDVGFRPSQVLVRAALNNGSLGGSWNGSVFYSTSSTDCGVAANMGGWSVVVDDEFCRITDSAGVTIFSAEFTAWTPTGFTYTVITATQITNLQMICIA